MAVDGLGVAYVTAGFLLAYSGYANVGLKDELTSFLKGQTPKPNPTGAPTIGVSTAGTSSTSSSSPGGGGGGTTYPATGSFSGGTAQQALQQAAKAYGWNTGAEWSALNSVEMAEAGYNPKAQNPSSGALGLAQALGHGGSGTAGSLGNEYGGYGLSDSEAQQANSGEPYPQAVWMVNYIKSTYGDPEAAWAHEQSAHWY